MTSFRMVDAISQTLVSLRVLTRVLYTSGGNPRSENPTTVVSPEAGCDDQNEGPEGPEMENAGQSPFQESHFGGPRGRQNPTPSANRVQSAKSCSSSSRLNLTTTLGDMLAATSSPTLTIPVRNTEQCILVDRPPVDVPSSKPGLSSTSTERNRPRKMQTQSNVNMVTGRGKTDRDKGGIIYAIRNH